MGKLNRRRLRLLQKLILRTKINADLLKYSYNRWRWFWVNIEKDVTIPHPTNGMIELGNVCNLHCNICPREYEYGKQMDIGFMPLDNAKNILDQMIPYLDSIGLTGLGETMMYPHLLDVLKHIKKRKPSIVTTVSTNAHFNGYLNKVTPLLPYLDCIQFSVDGCDKVYEQMRPGTNFAEITKNICQTIAISKNTEFMINFVISKDNYHDMRNIIKYAKKMNIMFVNFNVMSIKAMPKQTFDYYSFMKSNDFKEAVKQALEEAEIHPEMEITGLVFNDNEQQEEAKKDNQNNGFRTCMSMWEYPYITWDGYYVPCCGKPFPKLLNFGNVFENDLMSVINSSKAQAFRKLWQKNVPHKFCHNCIET